MSPEAKAARLSEIADQIDGARRLVVAGRMTVDKTHHGEAEAEHAEAICELLYEIDDRLRATAKIMRQACAESSRAA